MLSIKNIIWKLGKFYNEKVHDKIVFHMSLQSLSLLIPAIIKESLLIVYGSLTGFLVGLYISLNEPSDEKQPSVFIIILSWILWIVGIAGGLMKSQEIAIFSIFLWMCLNLFAKLILMKR